MKGKNVHRLCENDVGRYSVEYLRHLLSYQWIWAPRHGATAWMCSSLRITPSIKEFENLAETEIVTPKKISKRKMKTSLMREVKFLIIVLF